MAASASAAAASASGEYTPKGILLTGGAGFIGSHVACRLAALGFCIVVVDKLDYCANLSNLAEALRLPNVTFVQQDVTDVAGVGAVFAAHPRLDTVMHFAAQTHVDNSFGNSFTFTHNNVMGTHVMLEAAKQHGRVRRFIHVSTDEVYGDGVSGAASNEAASFAPTNPYAATKCAAECLVQAYARSFGLPVIITRSNNIYGPKQYPEKLVPKFINLLLKRRDSQLAAAGTGRSGMRGGGDSTGGRDGASSGASDSSGDSCSNSNSTWSGDSSSSDNNSSNNSRSGSSGDDGGAAAAPTANLDQFCGGKGHGRSGACRLPIHGNGLNSRNYLYTSDVVAAFEAVLRRGALGEVYNIGTDLVKRNIEVAADLVRAFGFPLAEAVSPTGGGGGGDGHEHGGGATGGGEDNDGRRTVPLPPAGLSEYVQYVSDRPFNDLRYPLDSTKLQKLGWTPVVTWEDGLRRTIDWYTANRGYYGDIANCLVPHPRAGSALETTGGWKPGAADAPTRQQRGTAATAVAGAAAALSEERSPQQSP